MSETKPTGEHGPMRREEEISALFAHMVMQQSNMAMMLLGKIAHPESGETIRDIDAARLFIDQLEMLEVKTKGNLNKQEEGLLKQSLMSLRLAFVEAVEAPPAKPIEKSAEALKTETADAPATKSEEATTAAASDEESRKKFSKKY